MASAYAISFGGNAVTAAFCGAKWGIAPDVLAAVADDQFARMFPDMASRDGITIHHGKVRTSPLLFVMPKDGKPPIIRCRDENYLHCFSILALSGGGRFNATDTSRMRQFITPSCAGKRGY